MGPAAADGGRGLAVLEGARKPRGDEARLGRLRWEYARGYNVRFLTADAVTEEIVRHRFRGREATAPDEVPAALQRVDSARLAAVGQQCRASGGARTPRGGERAGRRRPASGDVRTMR
jgi:hypothetical protein